ncbi:Ig-like domain-containing protein [Anaeromicropila herbilytica]|uniref:BIG2 domain-containing protein n=1 Tax=Anaeromicropila herbilytica TaxID=2785025 RepID=A0A7R7EID2_9FIRM|nr:Ig-like domain-containing protein [Anaeromicropila herbilytica]BCN29411.1 hypothetical protein bsdtb5_07060 [Anaeromicropila herbilytica]
MSHLKKFLLLFLSCSIITTLSFPCQTVSALSLDSIPYILLSQYKAVTDIGDKVYLLAVTSNGKLPTWKSSDSKVASVNTYGIVTTKKAGTVLITAKIKNAETSCYIIVNKTTISLSATKEQLERGDTYKLSATTSNDSSVTWKSSKKSVATVNEQGIVTALKPGITTITAKADGSNSTCTITVKLPEITLNKTSIILYRGQSEQLLAKVSSNMNPKWKTTKKSVAVVDETGSIIAIKHGTATITATVDGVSKSCQVVVLKPEITLSSNELTLKKGTKTTVTATVSSNNYPEWTSSNSNIVSVNSNGDITALQKGTAYIYASEDGTKVRCKIRVTE